MLSILQPYGLRTSGSPWTHSSACTLAVHVACVSAVSSVRDQWLSAVMLNKERLTYLLGLV